MPVSHFPPVSRGIYDGRLPPYLVCEAEFTGRHRACDADLCGHSPGLSQGSTHVAGEASMGGFRRADRWSRSGVAGEIDAQGMDLSRLSSSPSKASLRPPPSGPSAPPPSLSTLPMAEKGAPASTPGVCPFPNWTSTP